MGDSRVHRVRFYNIEPKAIHCMAYAPDCRKLALSRADSSIEVWNLRNTAFLERVIPGRGSVESLSWAGERLFSSGINARVIEHNLKTLTIKHSASVTAGPAWCLGVNRQKTCLAVGTEEGYINIFSIEYDNLTYEKVLDKQEGRILCLTWDSSGDFIATGSIDAVRIWNVHTGHAVHKMNTSRDQAKKETIVWCIAITDDFTVISGDSRGKICFWNGHTGINTETYHCHDADILCLALSDDQSTVYCSGVDPLIATFTRISITSAGLQNGISGAIGASKKESQRSQWCRSANRRIHEHDIRAIAVCHEKLCSGGIDSYLAVSWPPRVLVKYPPIPQAPCVMVCPQSRSLLLKYTNSLEVWKLGNSGKMVQNGPQNRMKKQSKGDKSVMNGNANEKLSEPLPLEQNPVKILELKSRQEEHIVCSALSNDSKWLAYSTESLLRIYTLSNSEEKTPQLDKVSALPEGCGPAHHLKFTSDSNRLVLVPQEGHILMFKLNSRDQSLALHSTLETDKVLKDAVHLLEVSGDGRFVVAGDLASNIAVWRDGKFYCSLPKYTCTPAALNISPCSSHIVVVYVDNKIVEYSLEQQRYTVFTKKLDGHLPKQWLSRNFPVINIVFDPRAPNIIILQDDNTICVIDKKKRLVPDAKIPRLDTPQDTDDADERRAHPGTSSPEHAFHVIKRYKHLVYFGWLDEDESVAVEVNPLRLLKQLPPALYKKRFGM